MHSISSYNDRREGSGFISQPARPKNSIPVIFFRFTGFILTRRCISTSRRLLSLNYALLDLGKNPLVFPFGIFPAQIRRRQSILVISERSHFLRLPLRLKSSWWKSSDFLHFGSQMPVRHGDLLPIFLKRYAASELALLLMSSETDREFVWIATFLMRSSGNCSPLASP
jgi:hypothetical protein